MTNSEDIRLEIDKQIAAGFTADEIRANLRGKQYSSQDIEAAMKQSNVASKAKSPSSGLGVVSLLVSIYFIINGCMKMNKYESGTGLYIFGIIMICVGVGGLIFKSVDMARNA